MEKILDRVQEWIKAADQKISVLLAFQGVVVGIFAPKILAWMRTCVSCDGYWSFSFLLFGSASMAFGAVQILRALSPRVSHTLPKSSISFFGDIAKRTLTDYQNDVAAAGDDAYKDDLVSQTHASAVIANAKHSRFSSSVRWFFGGLALILIARVLIELAPTCR
jgi:hypothetical protein